MAVMKREEEGGRMSGEINAVLGRGTKFEGKLSFEGEVRIAGELKGEILSKDRLQIDEGANIFADITVGAAIIYGNVVGNVKALESVELRSTAHLKGNIETPQLFVERGARFDGSCVMEGQSNAKGPTKA